MHLLKLSAMSIVITALSACSNSPSESEAKAVIQNSIGNCSYLSIDSFKKVNGIPQGENDYQVDVSYTIKMTPIDINKSEAEKILSLLPKEEAELAEATQREQKYNAASYEYSQNILKSRSDLSTMSTNDILLLGQEYSAKYDADHPNEYSQHLVDSKFVFEVGGLHSAINSVQGAYRTFFDRFANECPNTDRNIWQAFFPPAPTLISQQEAFLKKYTEPATLDFTQTINLIKTDNGWLESR